MVVSNIMSGYLAERYKKIIENSDLSTNFTDYEAVTAGCASTRILYCGSVIHYLMPPMFLFSKTQQAQTTTAMIEKAILNYGENRSDSSTLVIAKRLYRSINKPNISIWQLGSGYT